MPRPHAHPFPTPTEPTGGRCDSVSAAADAGGRHGEDPVEAVLSLPPFERTSLDIRVVLERTQGVKFLDDLPRPTRLEVCRYMQPRKCAAQQWVVRQGDPGHEFFILLSGTVDVINERSQKRLNRLSRGAAFGEAALEFDQPRRAGVLATSPVTLGVLSRADYQRLLHLSTRGKMQVRTSRR